MGDRDEWGAAVAEMSELERVEACGHSGRVRSVCPDCGDDVRSEL